MSARSFVSLFLPLVLLGSPIDFESEVWPILRDRCIECHKAPREKNGRMIRPKAGLRLDGLAHIMFGSQDAPVIEVNHPSKSPLYNRVILAADDDDRMPPKGDPLSHEQCEILRQWIGQGVDFGSWVGAKDGLDALIRKDHQASLHIPEFVSFYQKLGNGVAPVNPPEISQIRKKTGLLIRPVGKGNSLLDVRVVTRHQLINDSALLELEPIYDKITKLDLRRTAISGQSYKEIARMSKLTELNLSGCKVGDEDLSFLGGLASIRTVNLSETKVSAQGINLLCRSDSLKKIYLWQSAVREYEYSKLKSQHPDLIFIF